MKIFHIYPNFNFNVPHMSSLYSIIFISSKITALSGTVPYTAS